MTGGSNRLRLAVLTTVIACLTVGLLAPTPALAGDNAASFTFQSDRIDSETNELAVESGETVTIDLVVGSHGDLFGNGLGELSATIDYDPDVITVTDVEHGPMLAAGDDDAEVNGTVEIDDEAGNVTVEQERTPSSEGAKTTDTAATLTLEIAEDVPPSNQPLEITDASPVLVSGSPQGSFERDLTITIDGGAADDGATADDDITDDDADGDDPVPGFMPLPVLAGIIGAFWLRLRARQ